MFLNHCLQYLEGCPVRCDQTIRLNAIRLTAFLWIILNQTVSATPALQRTDFLVSKKAKELSLLHQQRGFVLYKTGTIQSRINEEYPVFIQLEAGRWYHFVLVADPRVKKVVMRLGMPGLGDFITDKFKPEQGDSFWTEFSFVCPQSGKYLLTLFQKSQESFPFHITILQRPRTQQGQTVSYRMN